MRLLCALLALILATPALAETCPPGVGKLHGKCQQPVPATSMAIPIDPFAGLTPAPLAKQQPEIGQKVRSGETWTGMWMAGRARSGFEGTTSALVDGATLRTIKVTDPGEYGVSFCPASHLTIDGFLITRSGPTAFDMPTGIQLGRKGCGTSGADVLIQNGTISGFQSLPAAGAYPNGDGLAVAPDYTRVTIRNVLSSHNTDGCFDLQGTAMTLDGVTAFGCNRNYRLWGTGAATTVTSQDARAEDIWLGAINGVAANWHIAKLIVIRDGKNAAPILYSDNPGAKLTIDACELRGVPAGTPLIKGRAVLMLGPGCQPGAAR